MSTVHSSFPSFSLTSACSGFKFIYTLPSTVERFRRWADRPGPNPEFLTFLGIFEKNTGSGGQSGVFSILL
jgi:hypothetical protein